LHEELIQVNNLKKYFRVGKDSILKAVDNVSFSIKKGETLGLVGESGCGKTTCGRTIIGLYKATGGKVLYDGKDVHNLGDEKLQFKKKAQYIFQDPYASLDPRMTIGDIIAEGMDIHQMYSTKKERTEKVHEQLKLVGLNPE